MPQNVDVLICGAGSAGLCAGAWLSRLGISCKILEKRTGPLEQGQADGVQCRTVEVFDSFGLAEDLLREAYHVLEIAFWSESDDHEGIRRTNRAADTPPGLSHQPHVILNQARVNELLTEVMRGNGQEIDYGYEVRNLEVDQTVVADPASYWVRVVAEKDGTPEDFRAKYVLVSAMFDVLIERLMNIGSDGAHSTVRKSLGFKMVGDSTDAVWGVMDIYPQTNFPDIRKKATIHSSAGTLLIIPREGGSLVRFYIELPPDVLAEDVQLEDLQKTAQRIFAPYSMEIAETAWWSAYAIGQRLADHFSSYNRIFLAGDACHTHSPKAGQGMNVSLQDGYNIGWKLAAILNGQATPSLLETYILERQKVAHDLIEFDRYWTKLFKTGRNGEVYSEKFSEQFIKAGRYMAGLTAQYKESCVTSSPTAKEQSLATQIAVGMRFPSTQVVRFWDAKPMQLVKALPADGRWRVMIFAGDAEKPDTFEKLEKVCSVIQNRPSIS